jgi:hypothetical protein
MVFLGMYVAGGGFDATRAFPRHTALLPAAAFLPRKQTRNAVARDSTTLRLSSRFRSLAQQRALGALFWET